MCTSITQQFGGSLQFAAREVNVHFSNMRRFRELLVVHPTSPGPACSPSRWPESSRPDSCCNNPLCIAKEFLHHHSFCLREAYLHASRPHRGLHLTAARRQNRRERANALIRCRLARWRGVFCADVPRFFTGQSGWQATCGCGVMVWAY